MKNTRENNFKISIRMAVSQTTNHWDVAVEDLGFTEDEWTNLSEEAKKEALNEYVGDLPEQPYWVVDTFTENF